jgi:hypothetical protein
MKQLSRIVSVAVSLLACLSTALPCARGAEAEKLPDFQELYSLIRSNLHSVSESELNQAAVRGLLTTLRNQVTLVTNSPSGPSLADLPLLTRTNVFDDSFIYLRVSHVAPGLGSALASAVSQSRSTNKITGLVLDLRYAGGNDYAAAVQAADPFLSGVRPLLRWADQEGSSTAKTAAIDLPLTVLVNESTSGSAEALAGILQLAQSGLIIGSRTAGEAYIQKEFQLSNGQTLRMPSAPVQLANGTALAPKGVMPDVPISVDHQDEKAFFEDPYFVSPKLFAQTGRSNTNEMSGVLSTNRTNRRRLNEAELVRMQREGIDPESEAATTTGVDLPLRKIVTDPALARGLDFLKGLALVQNRH